jgi:hypothetical protein
MLVMRGSNGGSENKLQQSILLFLFFFLSLSINSTASSTIQNGGTQHCRAGW